jgi:hypothetical protein
MGQRLGRFRIRKYVLHRDAVDNAQYLNEIFANFIPLSINEIHETGELSYLGISTQFDEIEDGQIVPDYVAIIKSEVVHLAGWNHVVHKFDEFKKL